MVRPCWDLGVSPFNVWGPMVRLHPLSAKEDLGPVFINIAFVTDGRHSTAAESRSPFPKGGEGFLLVLFVLLLFQGRRQFRSALVLSFAVSCDACGQEFVNDNKVSELVNYLLFLP